MTRTARNISALGLNTTPSFHDSAALQSHDVDERHSASASRQRHSFETGNSFLIGRWAAERRSVYAGRLGMADQADPYILARLAAAG